LPATWGYLVVPYTSDLNLAEITIEAWVRMVDGDCGTLVGNGRDVSSRLASCRIIQFGYEGTDCAETGQHPLGDGSRHGRAREKHFDFECARVVGMVLAVVDHEALDPVQVDLFDAIGVGLARQAMAHAVQESGWTPRVGG